MRRSGLVLHSKRSWPAVRPTQPPVHWALGELSPSIEMTIYPRHSKCVAIRPTLSMCLHGAVIGKQRRNFPFTLTKPQYTTVPTTGSNKAARSPVLLSALCLDVSPLLLLSGIQSTITMARKLPPSIIH